MKSGRIDSALLIFNTPNQINRHLIQDTTLGNPGKNERIDNVLNIGFKFPTT